MTTPSVIDIDHTPAAEPRLAPPGAGLPKFELLIGRLRFALGRAFASRESSNARFQQERERIRQLMRPLSNEAAARRVLIKRVRGLEDSSRYWSVWMTLEHLRIVHSGLTRVIGALARGIQPPGAASTAAVKPSQEVSAAVVGQYEQSCEDLMVAVAAVENLRTPVKYVHPWFGPLDAGGWHTMAAWHMGVHRAQVERICEGLRGGM